MYPGLVQAAIQMFGPQWRKNNFIGAAFSQDFSMPDYLRIALPIVADRDVQRPERERSVAESFVQRLSQDEFTSYEEIKQVFDQAINRSIGAYAPDILGHPEVTLQEIRTGLDFLTQRPIRIDAKAHPFAVHDYFISQRLSAICDVIPGLSKKAFELYQQRPDQQLARKLLDENQYARNFVGFVIDLQELDDHVKLYREDEQVFFTARNLAEALVALQKEPEKFTKNYLLLKTVISQEAVEQLLQKALDGDGFSHPVVRVAARLLRQWFVFDSKKQ